MNRTFKILFVCFSVVLLVVGCGKKEEVPEAEEAETEATSGIVSVEGFDLTYSIEGYGIPCAVVGDALSVNLFEKSGHWAFLEEQELFDNKLIDWVSSH